MKKRRRSKSPTRLRYSPEAAYARGGATRAHLIDTAIGLFGRLGFEGTSTRAIATAAALNTPALQYYFGNKEGLYAACAEHMVSQGWSVMKDVVIAAETLLGELREPLDRSAERRLIAAFCAVQDRLADFLNDADGDWLLWLAREQAGLGPTPGMLRGHPKILRMMRVGRSLVARLSGASARSAEAFIDENVLNGHLLHFYLTRRRFLEALRWRRIDGHRLERMKSIIRGHTVASLLAIIRRRRRAERRRPARSAGGSAVAG
jgi:AcrR family transcriptional regulator